MSYLTRDLEITLGPGTGDLQMRFGLNSGKCDSSMTDLRILSCDAELKRAKQGPSRLGCFEERGRVFNFLVTPSILRRAWREQVLLTKFMSPKLLRIS